MKKSKIIVPALAVLLLSTAASISGTVAWFTASRTFATSVSQFGVGSIDGELKATVAAGIGTKQGANDYTILFATGETPYPTILTDASYDSSAATVYTDQAEYTEDHDGVNESSFVSLGTRTDEHLYAGTKGGNKYYYAVTWTITLKYEGAATSDSVHMLLDSAACTISASGGSNNAVGNGIRFNFEVGGASKINFAPLRDDNYVASPESYDVSNVASTSGIEHTQQLIAKDTSVTKLPDSKTAAVAATHKEYLGTVAPDTGLAVTVTCWLEGTDADVLSANLDAAMKIAGDLKFYCRTQGTDSTALS